MPEPQPLTRAELAKFLPDQRSIRAFEKLFEIIPNTTDELGVSVEEVSIDAGIADAKANQATSSTVLNEINTKSNGVLLWLSM